MSECAWCASRTKETFVSGRFKRIAARRGKKRATVAIAHQLLKIVYYVLKNHTVYTELGADYVDSKRKAAQIKYHKEQLNKLGVVLPEKESA